MSKERSDHKELSRRRLLAYSLFATLAALFVSIGKVSFSFIVPRKRDDAYGGIIKAGGLNDMPAPADDPVYVPKGRFWLVHSESGLSAFHSSCTHLNCRFSWDVQKGVFICPCHGSEFSRVGQVLKGPAERDLSRFPLRVIQNDDLVVEPFTESGDPLAVQKYLIEQPAQQAENDGSSASLLYRIEVDTSRIIGGATASDDKA
ncbi:MAG: ubiquinol-cytochrome c reductase iron-sulfur subunit [Desulfobulbaceae bacterium]|nr:MAG: ubiquinol-cytochrome c reductase iron-sulfur subunit [Desulfobulbaceae bacterium]